MPCISTVERDTTFGVGHVPVAALQKGRQEGRQDGQPALLLRRIERRFGVVEMTASAPPSPRSGPNG
jgi:hypothetical protein